MKLDCLILRPIMMEFEREFVRLCYLKALLQLLWLILCEAIQLKHVM